MSSYGVSNQVVLGNLSKTENIIGAAILVPVKPGRPSPSALPTQTTVTYSGVIPIAQASLCPKLVPVFHAIFDEDDVPEDQIEFIEINAVYSKEWPNIVEMKDHPADAEEWNGKPGKRDLLEK